MFIKLYNSNILLEKVNIFLHFFLFSFPFHTFFRKSPPMTLDTETRVSQALLKNLVPATEFCSKPQKGPGNT